MCSVAMQLSVEFVNNLVAVLNVLASQVATALDTLNFALITERSHQSDTRVSPRAPRNSRHGLRPRIITERISSDRSRSPTRIRTRPLDTSSTWYIPALSPPRAAHRHDADSNSGRRPESMLDRLPPPRPLASQVQSVHIQAHRRSARLLRWFMDLGNFYKNSPLPFAMRTLNLSRHGHRLSWMRWFDERKTRIPGLPTKPLLGSFRSPLRKSSRPGRSISNLRLAARKPCIKRASDHWRTSSQGVAVRSRSAAGCCDGWDCSHS